MGENAHPLANKGLISIIYTNSRNSTTTKETIQLQDFSKEDI